MKIIDIRRSVRTFTDKKVEPEKVDKILRAAMQSPSGMNQQPWEFLVLDTDEALNKVKDFLPNAKPLQNVQLMIIVLEKLDTKLPYFSHQSIGACIENILLETVDVGLGACWVGVAKGEREDFLRDTFGVPSNINPFAIISIGYPENPEDNKFVDRYDATRVHYNSY